MQCSLPSFFCYWLRILPVYLWIAGVPACVSPALGRGAHDGASAIPSPLDSTAAPAATLTIKVTDLRNHKGDLIFGVFKTGDGFPTEKAKSVNWQVRPADADELVFTCRLPPGRYAASVLHDENRNGKMDFNALGVPVEGYGVTNNPKPRFRKATFKEAEFTLPASGAALTISIQYF